MKKAFTISLALAIMLTLAACGGNNNPTPSSDLDSSYEDVTNPPSTNPDESFSDTEIDPSDKETTDDETKPETTKPDDNKDSTVKPEAKPTTPEKPSKPEAKPTTPEKPSKPSTPTKPSKPDKPAASDKNYAGSIPDLINGIYAKKPIDITVSEPTAIDLNDSNSLRYFTGLSDGSKVKEAYYSESMMGSLAYSMVVVRVKDASDATSVAQSMFDGIDQAKWICVTADALAVGAYGDTVMLAMVNSELNSTLHTDLRAAYTSVVGASKLDVALDRLNPDAVPNAANGVE